MTYIDLCDGGINIVPRDYLRRDIMAERTVVERLPHRTYGGVCPEASSTRLVTTRRIQESSNLKDSRPYPSNPLYAQTSLAKQFTQDTSYHHEREFLNIYAESCDGELHFNTRTIENNFYLDGHHGPFGSSVSPKWETQARLKIKDATVNLGTALAEYRQTSSMFSKFAKQALAGWRSFKGKRRRRKLTTDDVAAAQLISSYGLSPLISDVTDSYLRLQHRLDSDIIQRVVVTAKSDNTHVTAFTDGSNEITTEWQRSDRVILYVVLDPNPANFTLGNPSEIAWELVPYSFLIDQFINVGDTLSALDALNGVKSIFGTRSIKEKAISTRTSEVNDNYNIVKPGVTKYTSHERVIQSGVPSPRLPSWNPSSSWRTLSNDLALLKLLTSRRS